MDNFVTGRCVILMGGKDALPFLQGLVTNDVLALAKSPGIVWTALLSPQGKYLADFFVVATGTALLLDLPLAQADTTLQRLSLYRLRADVTFAQSDISVERGLGPVPINAFTDPRHPDLGWRSYAVTSHPATFDDDAVRVRHLIPESGIELISGESYILESGFERLNGVDFRKGCYVGQEVTARMKHKTELRKGLVRVRVSQPVPVGTPIMSGDKEAGTLWTQSDGNAIAYLRLDRSVTPLTAGQATVTLDP